jgi:hypothetical protein
MPAGLLNTVDAQWLRAELDAALSTGTSDAVPRVCIASKWCGLSAYHRRAP